eukprot:1190895-Prorocentrum_minimum.AAC.4
MKDTVDIRATVDAAGSRRGVDEQIGEGIDWWTPSLDPGRFGRAGDHYKHWSQRTWVYSHDGPIRRRKRGYILTMDQSDAGSVGIFSRWTNQGVKRAAAPPLMRVRLLEMQRITGGV